MYEQSLELSRGRIEFGTEKIVTAFGKQICFEAGRSPDKRRHVWGVYLSATVQVASEYLALADRQFAYYVRNFHCEFSRFAVCKQERCIAQFQ